MAGFLVNPGKGTAMSDKSNILSVNDLGFPWTTQDPFLFCVHHADAYPKGNEICGPDVSLEGRNLGNDFVLKDGWRMYHGRRIPGFPVHPHRGFETVTIVRRGIVDHSDSLGGAGRYGQGDVQWMTAGKGIQHAEMFPLLNRESDNPLEMFQIWLNLPARRKQVEPYYTMFWNKDVPSPIHERPDGRNTKLALIAGSFGSEIPPKPAPDSWAADPGNEVAIWYFEMDPGAGFTLPASSEGVNRSLFYFEGESVRVGGSNITRHCGMELVPGVPVLIENGHALSRFLYLQGKPIGEHVESYGPFVMNSKAEIQETFAEYRKTQFGGWPWPVDDPVHDMHQGRFAKYPGGKEEFPDTAA